MSALRVEQHAAIDAAYGAGCGAAGVRGAPVPLPLLRQPVSHIPTKPRVAVLGRPYLKGFFGGAINAGRDCPEGTFTRRYRKVAPFARGPETAKGRSGSATILVVEETCVSDFLRSVLSRGGYRVICASAKAAAAMLREGEQIDLLITNTPQQFTDFPDLPLIYMAASPDPGAVVAFRHCLKISQTLPSAASV